MAARHLRPDRDRWTRAWKREGVYRLSDEATDPVYVLGMFPYPSGSIHMGHVRNYSITDAYARYRRMTGDDVLHPMGWDAFGLPAENAAHERGVDPAAWTAECIETMREQLESLGCGYDWEREITTCEPEYYRWNQWLFARLYEEDLVDYRKATVNWCPSCETVLADAQVEPAGPTDRARYDRPRAAGGLPTGTCWRCGTEVTTRSMPQWFFRITEYADELVDGLEDVPDWPESITEIQRHWIGRRDGAVVAFDTDTGERIEAFTARVDTIYGATFVAISPDHRLATVPAGTRLPHAAIHPLTDEPLPVYVADYVLADVGTGAVMGVPAHNEYDHAFAMEHDLPVRRVIGEAGPLPDVTEGTLVDSGPYDGVSSERARETLLKEAAVRPETTYRLRDWLISRQRYWGTPIPIVHCSDCGQVLVPDEDLPVELPPFTPSDGNPLDADPSFVETTCPDCGEPARRETDTMDTFVDSSWYFLRFLSPAYDEGPVDPERAAWGLPVDVYVGGEEHAVLHLLYLRFVSYVLADLGIITQREPIRSLINQGTVLHGGTKMASSVGNVIAPHEYGPETTRLFVLSAAHPGRDFEWTATDVTGAYDRQRTIVDLVADVADRPGPRTRAIRRDRHLEREVDRTIEAAAAHYEGCRFHRVVAELDELVSLIRRYRRVGSANRYTLARACRTVVALLAPLTPFLAERLWEELGESGLVAAARWPEPLRPAPEYDRERALLRRTRADVREIVEVADIGNPQTIELLVASEEKFELYDRARKAGSGADLYAEELEYGSAMEAYRTDLAENVDRLEPVLSQRRERELLEQGAWLLEDEFDTTVIVGIEGTGGPVTEDARPNRPAISVAAE